MIKLYSVTTVLSLTALALTCFSPCCFGQAAADESAPGFSSQINQPVTVGGGPASGKLFGTVQRNDGLRINRARLAPNNTYSMDATQFAQPVLPPVNQPLAGQVDEAAKAPKKSTYVWNLSNQGGYYECTGQIKVVVPGDQLYKYGGTFIDGTAVPDTPVTTNFAGHVYRFPYVIKKQPQ